MKVLLISSKYQPEYSGSGLRAHTTYKRLKKKYGVNYDVVTNSVEFNNNLRYEYDGVVVTRIGKRLPSIESRSVPAKIINHFIELANFIYQGFITWKILKKGKYDIIHTFGSSISVSIGMLYARSSNTALLKEICNSGALPEPSLPFKLGKILKYHFNDRSRVVAISKMIGDFCRNQGLAEQTLWQRPNPVDETKFNLNNKDKYILRKKLAIFDDKDKVMVNVGKFGPGKNQKFLIEVLKHLDEKYKLLLFGPLITDGPFYTRDKKYFNDMIKTIKRETLENRVHVVVEFSEMIEEYYKLADVFVFPTKFEALGTPMLEAIACGIPVVANRIEGVTDYWIDEGKTGYVSELDAEKFSAQVVKACEIDIKKLHQGSEAILKVASTKVIDEQYYKIMNKLVNA